MMGSWQGRSRRDNLVLKKFAQCLLRSHGGTNLLRSWPSGVLSRHCGIHVSVTMSLGTLVKSKQVL